MSERAAKRCWFSFIIHEDNAPKVIQQTFLPSLLFGGDSEYWMTGQSHIRGFNHVVMKGNLSYDTLLRGLKQKKEAAYGSVPGLD